MPTITIGTAEYTVEIVEPKAPHEQLHAVLESSRGLYVAAPYRDNPNVWHAWTVRGGRDLKVAGKLVRLRREGDNLVRIDA